MIKQDREEIDIDDIIERIKAEVVKRKASTPAHKRHRRNAVFYPEIFSPRAQETRFWRILKKIQCKLQGRALYGLAHTISLKMKRYVPKYRRLVSIAYFEQYQDEEFIRKAYRGILMREPDPQGLDHYLTKLRSGRASKAEILGELRYSAEGRRYRVQIKGLFLRTGIDFAYRLPIIGRMIRCVFSCIPRKS